MEQHNRDPIPTIDEIKKKSSAYSIQRRAIAILLGIISLIIACIMVISQFGKIPSIGLGIVSIFIFWFALEYYHEKCPNCKEKVYKAGEKDDFKCPRCGLPTIN